MLGKLSYVWNTRKLPSRLLRFYRGYHDFRRTGKTSPRAYKSMRQLYVITNGRFNDWMALREARRHPPRPVRAEGVLGSLGSKGVAHAANKISRNGFHVFNRKLSAEVVAELVAFARSSPARYIDPASDMPTISTEYVRFDPVNPISPTYHFDEQLLLETEAIGRLVADQSFLAVAQEYLGIEPVLDCVRMWWSAPFGGRARSPAAQLYHFDMDRLKFVKFFVYLTDVDEDNGPHCYVQGSHRRKPLSLLADGRKTDDQIRAAYSRETVRELKGAAGTIIAADTRGFHKGKELTRGQRLILQVEFATSMFGANYSRSRFTREISEPLRQLRIERPRSYGALFGDGLADES